MGSIFQLTTLGFSNPTNTGSSLSAIDRLVPQDVFAGYRYCTTSSQLLYTVQLSAILPISFGSTSHRSQTLRPQQRGQCLWRSAQPAKPLAESNSIADKISLIIGVFVSLSVGPTPHSHDASHFSWRACSPFGQAHMTSPEPALRPVGIAVG